MASEEQRFGYGSVEDYERLEKIGEGTYGVVYKAKCRNGDLVALKKIRLEHFDEGIPSTAIREISLIKNLNHPNVIKLKQLIHNEDKLYLVFDFLEKDLKKMMDLGAPLLDKETVRSLLKQLLEGLHHCHSNRVFHRDLKPHNLLISKEGQLQIADFGLARSFTLPIKTYTHEIITLWYRPPEVLLGQRAYGSPVDIWSVGCIFYEMAHRKPMFLGDSEIDQIFKIFQVMGTPSDSNWNGVGKLPDFKSTFPKWKPMNLEEICPALDGDGIDLLKKMCAMNPRERITAKEALKHVFSIPFL